MDEELYILWTNDNILTSEKMVLMYAHNSILENWWKKVTVIIWGAPVKLVTSDTAIQNRIKDMMNDGVRFSACKTCADQLGVSNALNALGIEVIYWGEPLTRIIKSNMRLITI
jgi:hypothetical protein